MGKRLAGEHALVTGGGGGIGRAIALAMAREGAKVTLHYAHNSKGADETVAMIKEGGGQAFAVKGDLAQKGELVALYNAAVEMYGDVTVLVNNAGIGSLNSPDRLLEIEDEDWERAMTINVTAPAQLSKLVLPNMIERRHGSIINISSIRDVGKPQLGYL